MFCITNINLTKKKFVIVTTNNNKAIYKILKVVTKSFLGLIVEIWFKMHLFLIVTLNTI
jgi:hypothetical protein